MGSEMCIRDRNNSYNILKTLLLLFLIVLLPSIATPNNSLLAISSNNDCGLRAEVLTNKIPTCGEKDGSVTLNVTGGTGEYTYSWGADATRDDLASGFYCIVVTDETGCTLLVDFTLGDCPDCNQFEADIVIENLPTCNNENGVAVLTILAANGMPTFSWGESIKRDDLKGGTYAVTITDQGGCMKIVEFDLNLSLIHI